MGDGLRPTLGACQLFAGFKGSARNMQLRQLVTVLLCALAVTACATSPYGTWRKVLLNNASKRGAVCLDGSPGGYYIRTHSAQGVKADPKRWVVFHQGGGWCGSDVNCAARANMRLGSSNTWPATYDGSLASEASELISDPHFSRFTVVFAMYCDGGSWTGAATTTPVTVKNQTIFYRGRALLDAMLDNLIEQEGMNEAQELLYSGCSAGGLTTFLHADYVRDVISQRAPSARVVALIDAMYSRDIIVNSLGEEPRLNSLMEWGFTAWGSAPSVNQHCLEAMIAKHGVTGGWRCMFGASVAPFVQTPTFILNSKFDTWQIKSIIGANCSPTRGHIFRCSNRSAASFWDSYAKDMVSDLDALPRRHGAFVHNCAGHCQTGSMEQEGAFWGKSTIHEVTMGAAFRQWYHFAIANRSESLPRKFVERCDGFEPCGNDSCPMLTPESTISGV